MSGTRRLGAGWAWGNPGDGVPRATLRRGKWRATMAPRRQEGGLIEWCAVLTREGSTERLTFTDDTHWDCAAAVESYLQQEN